MPFPDATKGVIHYYITNALNDMYDVILNIRLSSRDTVFIP